MKNLKYYSLFLCAFALVLTSCTIQKRHYRSGYHVDFSKSIEKKTTTIEIPEEHFTTSQSQKTDKVSEASEEARGINVNVENESGANEEMQSRQQNISSYPSVVTEKTSIVHKGEAGVAVTHRRHSPPEGDQTTNKSQLVALLLCFFFGVFGIHRFYLGYIGIGLIQLFTAGGCGIWALIDLILIITGDLKPKNGDYGSKL